MFGARGIVARCCCGNNGPEPRHEDGGASRESGGVERVRKVCLLRCDVAVCSPNESGGVERHTPA